MQPFHFARTADARSAVLMHGSSLRDASPDPANASTQYLAGGTTLLDLMKLGVMRPGQVIDINDLEHTKAGAIEFAADGLRLGAMSRMSAAAEHPDIRRNFPAVSQSLQFAASAQIRNMASLGGNVLQRDVQPSLAVLRNPTWFNPGISGEPHDFRDSDPHHRSANV